MRCQKNRKIGSNRLNSQKQGACLWSEKLFVIGNLITLWFNPSRRTFATFFNGSGLKFFGVWVLSRNYVETAVRLLHKGTRVVRKRLNSMRFIKFALRWLRNSNYESLFDRNIVNFFDELLKSVLPCLFLKNWEAKPLSLWNVWGLTVLWEDSFFSFHIF